MKRLIYFIILTAVVLTGCETRPIADFEVSDATVYAGEQVYFYNYSDNSNEYEWDFGDGYYTYNIEPVHAYTEPGIYTVKLSAYKNDNVDNEYLTIEVLEAETYLTINVLEYYDKYPVEDASIILYRTYYDWENEINPVIEVYTDKDGYVTIEGLEPRQYYIDVWHPYHDNYSLADEDLSFIYIPSLAAGQENFFTAWVDYVEHPLKSKKTVNKSEIKSEKDRKYSNTH